MYSKPENLVIRLCVYSDYTHPVRGSKSVMCQCAKEKICCQGYTSVLDYTASFYLLVVVLCTPSS